MRFLTLTLVACATLGAVSADVSHLAKHYIPPRMMMPPVVGGSAAHMSPSNGMRLTHRGEHTVTTIEKQELRELPTQTEYLRPGQMPYGIGGNMENHHGPSDMRSMEHAVEKPLAMMMPRELLPPPPPPPAPTAIKQEQMTTVAPSKQYLAPEMSEMNKAQMRQHSDMPSRQYLAPERNEMAEGQMRQQPSRQYLTPASSEMSAGQVRHHDDMPSKQYLAPPMMEMQQQRQVSATSMPSRQYLAPMVKDQKQEQTEQQPQQEQPQPQQQQQQPQQHQQAQQRQQPQEQQQQPTPAAPSRQYLTPMLMQMRDQMHEMPAMSAPSRQYLAPAPTMSASNEQHLQQQSAPAPQYLPPQQQLHEMPVNQYLAPHSSDSHAMTMQQLMEQQKQMAPQATQPPATHYLPPAMQMQRELAASPMSPVPPPMQPTREYLSPFGEAENVAEAAQEVAEMFDDQSAQQPMPPPAAEGEEEPANYYLPPQSVDAQPINYQQYGAPSQSEPLAPVDFVRQHQQLMTQYNGVPDAPVSFAQFQSINSAEPTLQTVAEPTPAHYLADDGYHYRDGGNSNVLSNGNDDARRFRVRH